MCGLAGLIHLDCAEDVTPALIERMRDTLKHRGPDDSGLYINPSKQVGFGFCRLSIQDLSPLGHQPMGEDADAKTSKVVVMLNGEIYNFNELREELISQGHSFRSKSDTEVVVRLYRRDGFPGLLERLNGMFAIAIWDEQKKVFYAARDRMGIKPFYYAFSKGRFLFGSEIKAMLAHPALGRAVNEESFYHYLSFQAAPAPDTLFLGIHKLPHGHWIQVHLDGTHHVMSYWDIFKNVKPLPASSKPVELASELLARLRASVKSQMVSDVPFGAFLSGGVDSSTNVALMSELLAPNPVRSFALGYKGDEGPKELPFARIVADKFKTDHHELRVSFDDFTKFLWDLVHHQDEPIADPVCGPSYFLSKFARESGVTVCQVGEGADELFCGYAPWLELRHKHPSRLIANLALVAGKIGGFTHTRVYENWRRVAKSEALFWCGGEAFTEGAKQKLLGPLFRNRFKSFSSYGVIAAFRQRFKETSPFPNDELSWMSYADMQLRLPELLLMRVDKMTMAAGLEARVPFLDHTLVEFAMSIPSELKVFDEKTKALLKLAVRNILPPEIIDRPKQGFGIPLDTWMDQAFGIHARKILDAFTTRTGYFDKKEVDRLFEQPKRMAYGIWNLLNFALWHEKWIEGLKKS